MFKYLSFALILSIYCITLAIGQNNPENDDEEIMVPQNEPHPRTPNGRPRFDRFQRWMDVLREFFTEGNWLNGGPDNFLDFITKTLSKLLDILFNREPMSIENNDDRYNDNGRLSGRQRLLTQQHRHKANHQQLSLDDMLRMIPLNQLNNLDQS
ncbi:hypothetical protein SSS_05953 [Sarcoptes scabiei]|uniref:Uncharacterized protein n=2 Tax=Sarcoptes scabiei TaxID=52283 RepID=A0A834RA07_SARSC|nr:hypothetical protein SSS_05953 [Sarcoptes scabiei]UXI22484.1 ankyrin repeat and FYVE domain-containing protein 1 [Sarcoptes scabiei]